MRLCHPTPSHRQPRPAWITLSLILIAFVALASDSAAAPSASIGGRQGRSSSFPPEVYFDLVFALDDGEYVDALKGFTRVWRSGIKDVDGRWIDSICYYTMLGETCHRLGKPFEALDHFSQALRLARAYNNWMLRIQQFSPLTPSMRASHLRAPPWMPSNRKTMPARIPEKMAIEVGQLNNDGVVKRGGVVRAPSYRQVRAMEIIRCTALALRRRREILGPVCVDHPETSEIEAAFDAPIGPAGKWSEAWVKLLRGLAKASSGKYEQAVSNLRQSLLLQGRYDHPLTAIALVELGRLNLESNKLDVAAKYFAEAADVAYRFHEDIGVGPVEEALRYGQMTHIISGKQGPYPPLVEAAQWAKIRRHRELYVSLLTLLGEHYSSAGKPKEAVALLAKAKSQLGTRGMRVSRVAARLEYQIAVASYKASNRRVADPALRSALEFQRAASHRLLQIRLADGLWKNGNGRLTERKAKILYGKVLAETTSTQWATDPFDSLAVMTTPYAHVLENWFEVALASKDHEEAFYISELTRRHRFYSTLPLGGRLLTLRWLLEGPEDALSQQSLLARQAILARYPNYGELSRQAKKVQNDLKAAPLILEQADALREQKRQVETLAKMSQGQEMMLREIGLGRDPAEQLFPPLRDFEDVQKSLPDGHAMWIFFATKNSVYSMMINNKNYDYWRVPNPGDLRGEMQQLLRGMGNFGSNTLNLKQLTDSKWKESSRKITALLTKGSKVDLNRISQELTIVPDGLLWYLPFEALQIGPEEQSSSLISKIRTRYAPMASLGQPYGRKRPRFGQGHVAVKLGRLHPREDPEATSDAFQKLKANFDHAVAIDEKINLPSPLLASLVDSLIVLDDIATRPGDGPYDWSPTQLDRSRTAGTLKSWFSLPFGGPEYIILPGYHTAAENAIKPDGKTPRTGNEIFLAACGLMSTGARTILISRWRNGGKTSNDLIREYTQELPFTSATNAWQRSVQLAMESPLDPEAEPRVANIISDKPLSADHPLLWSGYLLIDVGAPGRDDEAQAAR